MCIYLNMSLLNHHGIDTRGVLPHALQDGTLIGDTIAREALHIKEFLYLFLLHFLEAQTRRVSFLLQLGQVLLRRRLAGRRLLAPRAEGGHGRDGGVEGGRAAIPGRATRRAARLGREARGRFAPAEEDAGDLAAGGAAAFHLWPATQLSARPQ